MNNGNSALKRFARNETAVSSIEYALIASLIAIVCVGAVYALGGTLNALYQQVCNSFPGATC